MMQRRLFSLSGYRALLAVIAIVFAVESLVMLLMSVIAPDLHGIGEALLDASLLTFLAGPLLWRVLVKPLRRQVVQGQARAVAVMDGSTDAIVTLSLDGTVIAWNRGAEQVYGYRAGEMHGESIDHLVSPEHSAEEALVRQRVAQGESVEHLQSARVRKDGRLVNVSVNLCPLRDGDADIIGMVEVARDVTQTQRAENAIKHIVVGLSSSIGASFFDAITAQLAKTLGADIAFVGELLKGGKAVRTLSVCADGHIIDNFEYDLAHTPCARVIGREACSYSWGVAQRFPEDEALQEMGAEAYVGVPLFGSRNQPLGLIVVLFREPIEDIDYTESVVHIFAARTAAEVERMRTEERMEYLAYHDELTELPNRTLAFDRLDQVLARSKRENSAGALLYIDLDGFKTINESLGHPTGDALLKEIAQRLLRRRRAEDTVARVGGDEFIVLLPRLGDSREAAAAGAQAVAEAIQADLSQAVLIAGRRLHLTPSIGVVLFPHDAGTADDLFACADTAMHRAKAQGRDMIQFFLPAMQSESMKRLALHNDLHHAIKQNELLLHFQPQVDIESGRIIGAEALLRWHHPERGLISPAEFIPIAEESGLILPIGTWVLANACRQAKQFLSGHYGKAGRILLSVNVSPRQFRQPDFAEQVERIVNEAAFDPGNLTLELTESMLIHDVTDVGRKLDALKALGVRLSIDDFGTGYSSLSYLKSFPLDILKIDRSFVHDIAADRNNTAIVSAIISMAESLNLCVVAEGVETTDQLAFLKSEGCDACQGYLFGRPLPIEEFTRLLSAGCRETSD